MSGYDIGVKRNYKGYLQPEVRLKNALLRTDLVSATMADIAGATTVVQLAIDYAGTHTLEDGGYGTGTSIYGYVLPEGGYYTVKYEGVIAAGAGYLANEAVVVTVRVNGVAVETGKNYSKTGAGAGDITVNGSCGVFAGLLADDVTVTLSDAALTSATNAVTSFNATVAQIGTLL